LTFSIATTNISIWFALLTRSPEPAVIERSALDALLDEVLVAVTPPTE